MTLRKICGLALMVMHWERATRAMTKSAIFRKSFKKYYNQIRVILDSINISIKIILKPFKAFKFPTI